ncbi:DUF2637 domain-containing protein [Streptomonospora wellingtoniae]|uniref:DUF2637 domain-containing protein n=1 Tax=Streptomonospora wellingtoniae TaxID=3075544 RepID=A0ABU2KXG6_9ACTN|nr:DUF2637 domain-containing protein [Streptomonospora sp. DSM 45055]MDT0303992.1 DUF2637 domain-containing protein [Streptomonospora sp. DSM 45055]
MNAAPNRLSGGQRAAVVLAVAGMVAVGAYGLVISYVTVKELALDLAMPLPAVFPLGIEGGLVAVLAMDLVLTWVGRPIGWLRQIARLFSGAAIGINVAAGWEHGVLAMVMHALAPIILITGVEALRTHLLRLVAEGDPHRREPIPRARWLLAPRSTLALWRRMVLWQVPRYSEALDADLDRREIVHALAREFGRGWAKDIPADVAYRLKAGVRLGEAIERARTILAERHPTEADAAALGWLDPDATLRVALAPTGEGQTAAAVAPGEATDPAALSAAGEAYRSAPAWPIEPPAGARELPVVGRCMAAHHRAPKPRRSKATQPKQRRADAGRSVAATARTASPVRRTTEERARELDRLIGAGDLTEDASINRIRQALRTSPENAVKARDWRHANLTGESTSAPDPLSTAVEQEAA